MSVIAVLGWTVCGWAGILAALWRLRSRLLASQLSDACALFAMLVGAMAFGLIALWPPRLEAGAACVGAVVMALSAGTLGCAYLSRRRRRLLGLELFLAGLLSWQCLILFLLFTGRLTHPGAKELRLAVLWPVALWALGTFGASLSVVAGARHERTGLALPLRLAWRLLVAPSTGGGRGRTEARRQRPITRQTLATVTRIAGMGVTLGVWLVLVALGVLSGFEQDLTQKIMGSAAHLSVARQDGLPLEQPDQLAARLTQVAGVCASTALVETEVAIASGSNYVGGVMLGMEGPQASRVLPVLAQIDVTSSPEKRGLEDDAGAGGQGLTTAPVEPGMAGTDDAEDSPQKEQQQEEGAKKSAVDSSWSQIDLNRCDPLCPAFLGSELARSLAVDVGATIRVISPTEVTLSPLGAVPKSLGLKVVGLVTSKLYDFDGKTLLVGRKVAASFSAMPNDAATSLAISVADPENATALGPRVLTALAPASSEPLRTESWQSRNQTLFAALALERIVAAIVLAFIILVAAFAVVNTLTMHIFERRWEIAILRAMGASDTLILRTFVFQGLFIGALGTFAGAMVGIATLWALGHFRFGIPDEVYYIDALPVQMAFGDVVWVVLAGLLIVWDFAVWPSMRAACVRPAWGLRDS